jgi:hypothetical protein
MCFIPVGDKKVYIMVSRPTAGPTKPSVQWVLGVLSQWVRQLVHVDNSPLSSIEVKSDGTVQPFLIHFYGVVLN